MLRKTVAAALALTMLMPVTAWAYDGNNLPDSMTFAEAISAYGASEIESANICDTDENKFKLLSRDEITYFYNRAKDMTVWRKTNPTPFRGTCVNFVTTGGKWISYYYNSGIQIGMYGDENYVCYMPASSDTEDLRYLESEFFDSSDEVYGGTKQNVITVYDFLKLPQADWAKKEIKIAARKNLVPYSFTDKYEKPITREQMTQLIANWIVTAGNYKDMDAYIRSRGEAYIRGYFADCKWRSESIDQLYALGIVTGRSENEFDPEGLITRQEAAVLMTRAADLFMYISTNYKLGSADKNKVASWADYYVRWCLDKKLMSCDSNNRFNPNENMSVQQAITVLSRLYDLATYWES